MRAMIGRTLGLLLLTIVSGGITTAVRADDPLAYRVLGDLAVMDRGRIKPLSTLAIDRVKSIYSRQTIKVKNNDGSVEKWGPVAAYVDWSARPDFWNDKEFILVEYVPLKTKILEEAIVTALEDLDKTPDLSPTLKALVNSALQAKTISESHLAPILERSDLPQVSRPILASLAHKLSVDNKWLSPTDLETAEIDVDGQSLSLFEWYGAVLNKRDQARNAIDDGTQTLSDVEKKLAEVAERLIYFEAIRDSNPRKIPSLDLNVMPRPTNAEYLQFTADSYRRQMSSDPHAAEPTDLEMIAVRTLSEYLRDRQSEDRRLPGALDPDTLAHLEEEGPAAREAAEKAQAEFNEKYAEYVRTRTDWIPLRILLNADLEELQRAGFPSDRVGAFRAAFTALRPAEAAAPHQLEPAKAEAVVVSARELGQAIGGYPSATAMARESHFNRLAPFYLAPAAFGLGFIALLLSLGISARPPSLVGRLGSALYTLGMTGLLAGILLEAYGFYLRVVISGWAPVTNMYETVIWVSLFTAVMGFIYELMTRHKFVALAATGVALLTAVLAANVSLLDPSLKTLPPVLRSNYWLTIHVLTIVSSYAAFALALVLGLIAVGFYLTASYRRSVPIAHLAAPVVPGLPMLLLGAMGMVASYGENPPAVLNSTAGFVAVVILTTIGGMLTIMGLYAAFGELCNRAPRKAGIAAGLLLLLSVPVVVLVMTGQARGVFNTTVAAYASWIVMLMACSGVALSIFGKQARETLAQALSVVTARRNVSQSAQIREAAAVENRAATLLHAAGSSAGSGGVATLPKTDAATLPDDAPPPRSIETDVRSLSMQSTAARIKPIANFIYRAMQVGVLLCAAGTILGGVWANDSWGRFWGWDAKEVWALATLIFYLVPLHGRFAGWVNTFGLVVASVVCFSSVLMAWYGVNFVIGIGLHSYGFVEGGSQGVVSACCLAVVAVMGGAWWRRRLSSQPVDMPATGTLA